jgi:hypothetical protein
MNRTEYFCDRQGQFLSHQNGWPPVAKKSDGAPIANTNNAGKGAFFTSSASL